MTIRKKNSSQPGLLRAEVVEEALRFGRIDSKLHTQDEDFYMLLFTPRKAGGTWSRANKETVDRLIREGKMTAAELAKIESAKRDGSWNTLTDVDELRIPEDLQAAMSANPTSRENFDLLSDSMKKQMLWWIAGTKKAETRAKRIQQATEKLRSKMRNPFS